MKLKQMCGQLCGDDDRLLLVWKHRIHASVLATLATVYFRQHHISSSFLLFRISERSLWPFVPSFLTNAVPHLLGRRDYAAPPSDIICLYLRGNAWTVKFRFQRALLKTLCLITAEHGHCINDGVLFYRLSTQISFFSLILSLLVSRFWPGREVDMMDYSTVWV